MNQDLNLLISPSPQIHQKDSTAKIMWTVSLALLPAAGWAVFQFGLPALLTLLASIFAAVMTEALITYLMKKPFSLGDGSAFLTGLLVGMNMPPEVPGFIPVIASAFAIGVVKMTFGGLGGNWMNPALAGRAIVFFSWTGPLSTWSSPLGNPGIDVLSGASPLGYLKTSLASGPVVAHGPLDILREYPVSSVSSGISQWLSSTLGVNLDAHYLDLFLGQVSGSLGEISALLLLLGAFFLWARKIISWDIPVAYIASFGLLVWVFGGMSFGQGAFSGDVFFHLFSGGLFLGALFMATDMVTSPLTLKGRLIFGLGCGLLTYMIRFFGSFPEGVSLAIIIMNFMVPMINRYTGPVRFGVPKRKQEEQEA